VAHEFSLPIVFIFSIAMIIVRIIVRMNSNERIDHRHLGIEIEGVLNVS